MTIPKGTCGPAAAARPLQPVLLRLQAAARSPELARRVEALGTRFETEPAGSTLQMQDEPVRRPRYLVAGWACRHRQLQDGRRQIFDLVLPGEGVGVCLRPHPLANTNTLALTPVKMIDAKPLLTPDALADCPELRAALQEQADADERRALDQMMRLGRLTALERLGHLLLDLYARLEVIGQAENGGLPLPITQETIADVLGLSVVHVNRTSQELRRRRLVQVDRGWATLHDRAALAQLANYEPHPRAA